MNEFDIMPLDLQGWNSQHPVFEQLINDVKPTTIIEVGTWKGASAVNMLTLCRQAGLYTRMFCVDTWLGSVEFWTRLKDTPERNLMLKHGYPQIYYQFISNLIHTGFKEQVEALPVPSVTGAQILAYRDVKADMIYIDASHEFEDVQADIKAYKTLLRPGGVMFGDDYGWPGVKHAVHVQLGDKARIIDGNYWIVRI